MHVGEELAALNSSCWEGLGGLANPVCALAGTSLLLHLLLGCASCQHLDRKGGRAGSPWSQHGAGSGKMTVIGVMPSSPTSLLLFKSI